MSQSAADACHLEPDAEPHRDEISTLGAGRKRMR
jgi:hypothetical protein